MKILVAGDFCDKLNVSQKIKEKAYSSMFDGVRDLVSSVDYSIVNFEFPVVLTEGAPIKKCGPNLKGQQQSIEAIQYVGFNCCTLANNHILDQGEQCGLDTKRLLEEVGIDTVGFGSNEYDAKEILYKEIENAKLAIVNCCEHEFSIATPTTAGANALNPIQQYYSIREAKTNADYVLVIVHGGHEHFQLPSIRMKETYRFFIDAGADAVVNHHQHCYSGYEIYNGKPIFYGLGNFLFDRLNVQNSLWNYGYMVSLTFAKEKVSFELHPYSQCNPMPSVKLLDDNESNLFYQEVNKLNEIILDDEKHKKAVTDYYRKSARWTISLMEPYKWKVFSKLFYMGFLPSFMKGDKVNVLLNHLECESHRDKMLFALNDRRNGRF